MPETEPQRLSFGVLTQTHPPPRGARTHDPTTTITSYVPPPHLYSPSPVPASHGMPETEPQRLGFGVLTQTHPLPRVARMHDPTTTITSYAQPPHPYAPPPPLLPLRTARPKPSHSGSVSVFHPNPSPLLVFRDRTTPPPPPPRTYYRHTPTHRPPCPLHTAGPKPSHSGSVSELRPNPPPRLAFHGHTAPPPPPPGTCCCPTPKHHPPCPFHMAHPKPSHGGSVLFN
jgi:hypothetical protein